MRCCDARKWLSAQRDGDLEPSQAEALQAHLAQCEDCRAQQQHERRLSSLFTAPLDEEKVATPPAQTSRPVISTDRIMRAVQQQRQVTNQLNNIRQQQQTRVARMRKAGTVGVALSFLLVSSMPLLFLIVIILQTDFAIKTLAFLERGIDTVVVLGVYLQRELVMITRNSILLSGLAFVVVVMMGMWLRLMRPPREA
jgi:Predicted transmembrane transcriptional regulator (anti-sigma factor)